jgi:hypothetical protein
MQDGLCYKQNRDTCLHLYSQTITWLRYLFFILPFSSSADKYVNGHVKLGLHSLYYISYCFVPIVIDQSSRRLLVGVMVGFVSGNVSVAERFMWLLAQYFADGCISIHCDTL